MVDEHKYSMKMRLAVKLGGGDDANVNSQSLVTELFRIGSITRLMQNYGRLPCVHKLNSLEIKVPMVCLATGCVSRRRDAH